MEAIKQGLVDVGSAVEVAVEGWERWRLVATTSAATLAAMWLHDLYTNRIEVTSEVRSWVFRTLRKIPQIQNYIQGQLEESRKEIEKGMFEDAGAAISSPPLKSLPTDGWTAQQVLDNASSALAIGKYDWRDGRISGGTFSGGNADLGDLLLNVYGLTALTNPLHADIFPGVRKMEAEVVAMTLKLFNAPDDACGCMTLGGSESILMAVKAARDHARKHRGVDGGGQVVMAVTAHAGFDKAAAILGVSVRKVAVDPRTFKVDVGAMRRAITSKTLMLVASAPEFPHGIIDDVAGVAALGEAYSVPVHVDACMGGYLLPFMEGAGYPLEPFDFRVKGVTSISADTHKYGQAHKGSSVLMYRHEEMRHCQYFVTPDWPGGIYATPTVPGSRPGGLVAVCWAALLYHGVAGYTEAARDIVATARDLKTRLREVPGIEVFGDPLTSIVAFHSTEVNILSVGDLMAGQGWHLTFLQYPPGLHVCLTSLQATKTFAPRLVEDLKKAMDAVRSSPKEPEGVGKVYGTAAAIPDKSLVGEAAKLFLTCYYDAEPPGQNKQPEEEEALAGETGRST